MNWLDPHATLLALCAILLLAFAGWLLSVARRDVSIVDSLWSLFFLCGALVYFAATPAPAPRAALVLSLVAIWALRLSGYLTWRNHGQPEDHRYQAMRARNQPGFAWKSLYLVFGLQAVLAAIIGLPLYAAMSAVTTINAVDLIGFALWAVGFAFETIGDWQLARFKADPSSRGKVLQTGLWRYTRHPNYFGEAVLWWGYYLLAVAAGGWWTIFAPLLMTVLLLKVSGVALLERDIGERRPGYRDYIARTNAFIPGRPKAKA